jgi:hypothetical protein
VGCASRGGSTAPIIAEEAVDCKVGSGAPKVGCFGMGLETIGVMSRGHANPRHTTMRSTVCLFLEELYAFSN